MNGTSGIDVDPVAGEVYMCQQRGEPRVTVWDEKTGKLLRSWGNSPNHRWLSCRLNAAKVWNLPRFFA